MNEVGEISLDALLHALVSKTTLAHEKQVDILAHITRHIKRLTRITSGLHSNLGITTSRVAETRSPFRESLNSVYELLLPWSLPSDLWADSLLSTAATRYHHLRTITGHRLPTYCVLFDRADRRFITGGDDGLVKVWCARTGLLLYTLRGHSNCISDMSVDASNTVLAVGSIDGYISFWNLVTGRHLFAINAYSPILTLEFQPIDLPSREIILMSTCSDGYAKFWAVDLQQRSASTSPIKFHCKSLARDEIRCASFSPAGLRFVTGATDGIVRLLRVPQLAEIKANQQPATVLPLVYFLEDHLGYVNSVHYRADGRRFLTSSWDGCIREWWWQEALPGSDPIWKSRALEVASALGSPNRDAHGRPRKVTIVSYCCGDSGAVCAVNQTFELVHFNLEDGNTTVLKYHEGEVYILTAHPFDDRILLSAGCDGRVAIWDISRKRRVFEFFAPNTRFLDGGFCQDGSMFALVDDLGRVSLFGCGISPSSFEDAPTSQFFPTDWNELVFDANHMAIDSITQRAADLIDRSQIVSIEKEPHETIVSPGYADSIPTMGDPMVTEKQTELFQRQKANENALIEREAQSIPPGTLPKHTRSRRRRLLFGSDVELDDEIPTTEHREELYDEAVPLLYAGSETEAEVSVTATDEVAGSPNIPYNLRRTNRALAAATEAASRVAARELRERRLRELAERQSDLNGNDEDELYRPSLTTPSVGLRVRRRNRRRQVIEEEEEDFADEASFLPKEPPAWLSRKERQLFPYLPQLFDVVAYFPEGHRLFLQNERTTKSEFGLPVIPFDYQNETVLFGQVMEVNFYTGSPVWCQVQLLLLESQEVAESLPPPLPNVRHTHDEITIAFYDQPGQADFIIPYCRYAWSVARPNRFRVGEVVRVRYGGEEVYEARIKRLKVSPTRMASNPWQCYQVEWLSLDDQPEWLSPWELETILEEDEPERIPYECHEMLDESLRTSLLQGIDRISKESMSIDFRKPVDVRLVSDYFAVVAYPMDLSLIKARLRSNYYRRLEAFEWDCKLIYENAYLYNEAGSVIIENADRLVKALLRLAKQSDRQTRRVPREASRSLREEVMTSRLPAPSRAALERESRARRRASLNLRQSSPPSSAFGELPVPSSVTRRNLRNRPTPLTLAVSTISSVVGSTPSLRRKRPHRGRIVYDGSNDDDDDLCDSGNSDEGEEDIVKGKRKSPSHVASLTSSPLRKVARTAPHYNTNHDDNNDDADEIVTATPAKRQSTRTSRRLRILDESISDTAEETIPFEPPSSHRSSREHIPYSLRNRNHREPNSHHDEGPSQPRPQSNIFSSTRRSARLRG